MRMLLLLGTILAVLGFGAAPASAQGGCGPGFILTGVGQALLNSPGSEVAVRAADANGDGSICVGPAPGGGVQFVDN